MSRRIVFYFAVVVTAFCCGIAMADGEPLKVYILAGQSNMEGQAWIETFDYIGDDPATAPLLKEMRGPDGTPRVCETVSISYLTGPPTVGKLAHIDPALIVTPPKGMEAGYVPIVTRQAME